MTGRLRTGGAATDRRLTGRDLTVRVAALAVAGLVLQAAPANAHPFVRDGEVPVDSRASLTLAMAHGCESESSGEGLPTTDVSLEVPDWMRVVEVADRDGWQVEREPADGDAAEVITWTAADPQEPAPAFELDVVVSGEVGDERYLRVFQACDDEVYRWVGTPDDPADDPAVRLTLAVEDPSSPPPAPEPEPDPGPDDEEPTADDTDGIRDTDTADADTPAGTGADDADAPDDVGPGDAAATDPVQDDEGADGASGWLVVVAVVPVAAGAAAWLGLRKRATS